MHSSTFTQQLHTSCTLHLPYIHLHCTFTYAIHISFCSPEVISWRSKPWTWLIRAWALCSVDHMSDWSQEWSCLPRLLICQTIIQRTTVFATLFSYLRRKSWSNSRIGRKGVIASGKSCSYSRFAFSCSRTPANRTSFSRCCRKHGNVQAFE